MKQVSLILMFLGALLTTPTIAASYTLSLDAATSLYLTDDCILDGSSPDRTLLARLRPSLMLAPTSNIFLSIAYELNGLSSDSQFSMQGTGKTPRLRIEDLEREIYGDDGHSLAQNLDRAFLTWYGDGLEASFGRQPIGHGSGRIFNPSDIFAPLTPQSTYSEYKGGIDALRVRKYVGSDGAFEFISAAHRDGAEDAYYLLRWEQSLQSVNLSAYGGRTLGAPTFAFDVAADLGGTGIYGEGVARVDVPIEDSLRAVIGGHRRFVNGINALLELHYNGVGETEPAEYPLATLTREWRNGESFLLGKWYVAVEGDYQPHPLVTLSMATIANIEDGSALLQPYFSWAAFESGKTTVTLIGGGSFSVKGKDGEFDNSPDTIYIEVQLNF